MINNWYAYIPDFFICFIGFGADAILLCFHPEELQYFNNENHTNAPKSLFIFTNQMSYPWKIL